MIKINPTYRVTVFKKNDLDKAVIVEYPITCRFNSQRGTFSNSNKCTIELYNIHPDKRNAIFKDALVGDLQEENWKFVKLEAGWDGKLSQIFFGRILQAYSSKTGGQTDVITKIECLPFDIYNSESYYTFAAGTSYREAYKTMAGDLKNCEIGNIGRLEGEFKTQTTFAGKTIDCLNELTGGNTYIDNGVLNTLLANEAIDVPVPLVTDNNGLLETPIRRNASLTIKMLFEPTLIVGQLLEIKSNIQSVYDGQYKVLGFTHDCMISPTMNGKRTTTVELWAIPLLTSSNINLTNEKVTGGAAKVNGEEVSLIQPTSPSPKWIKPCNGPITSEYNEQRPGYKHNGIDIYVPIGTPVKAIADGTVVVVGAADGYGYWVGIDHGKVNSVKVSSEYGHILPKWVVNKGQSVKQGQIIAYSGNTGHSSGPHLHLTIRHGSPGKGAGKAVSPWLYINR